jgi:hypothetical protein
MEVTTDPLSGTRKIAELKTLIEKMAVRTGDCMDIMMGYIRILQKVAAQNASEEESAPPEEPEKPKKKKSKKKTTKKKED